MEAEHTSFTHCQLQAKGQITFGSAQHCSRVIQARKHPPGHSQAEFKQTGCIKSHVNMQPQALMSGLSECNSPLIPGVMGKTLSSHPSRHKENLFVLTSFSPLLKRWHSSAAVISTHTLPKCHLIPSHKTAA